MDFEAQDVRVWAGLSMPTLARLYRAEYEMVRLTANYEERKPLERRAACIWAIGKFRFPNDWHRILQDFDWPTPVSQFEGVTKTNPGFD